MLLRIGLETPRYLVPFEFKRLRLLETDVLVLGSGAAALRAALAAAQTKRVIVVTKRKPLDSNSRYAQGGIAAAIHEQDTFESHIADTLKTGWGLCDDAVVRTVITEGADSVRELIAMGAAFERVDGRLDFAREGGHSRARVLHRGDETGLEIVRALIRATEKHPNITFVEETYAIDLLTKGGACLGALVHDGRQLRAILAGATILATGGAGQIFRETTNPAVATGDGTAMAYRAGAVLSDLEFMQFHPTTLYLAGASRALVTEAVRGASGTLRDRTGRAFMKDYHPMGDLAPRDIVSRSMLAQMLKTGDTQVYLDITHIPKAEVRRLFPGLGRVCDEFGIDFTKQTIPVRPAAHYFVGGVKVDAVGRASIKRLYAAGESAAAYFHGANRLASNSLLECLVYGRRAGLHAAEHAVDPGRPAIAASTKHAPGEGMDVWDIRNSLRSTMWRHVGVERDAIGLRDAIDRMMFWSTYVMQRGFSKPAGWELQNMITVGLLMAMTALKREESRGTHYRTDFPKMDDKRWKVHLDVKG